MTRLNVCASGYTGKERDTESGLDYFGARYYGSSMGRFMSPDPVFASAARVMDPQQWNMYAYARNNPLSITDPTGLDFNLSCSGGDTLTCQNGVQGQTLLADGGGTRFEAADVDMNKQGDPSAGYSDQFGNNYKGTFDQNNGVSFTDSANGQISSHSQFIDGSDATQLSGSGAFAGIKETSSMLVEAAAHAKVEPRCLARPALSATWKMLFRNRAASQRCLMAYLLHIRLSLISTEAVMVDTRT